MDNFLSTIVSVPKENLKELSLCLFVFLSLSILPTMAEERQILFSKISSRTQEDDELDLELTLSLGWPVAPRGYNDFQKRRNLPVENQGLNLNGQINNGITGCETGSILFGDREAKRRRQDARKESEEKRRAKNNGTFDRVCFENHGVEAKEMDRERREVEEEHALDSSVRFRKSMRLNSNLCCTPPGCVQNSDGGRLVPDSTPSMGGIGGGVFRPYLQGGKNLGWISGGKDGGNGVSALHCTRGSLSSPRISDHQSTSRQGVSSSESGSHSSHSESELPYSNAQTSNNSELGSSTIRPGYQPNGFVPNLSRAQEHCSSSSRDGDNDCTQHNLRKVSSFIEQSPNSMSTNNDLQTTWTCELSSWEMFGHQEKKALLFSSLAIPSSQLASKVEVTRGEIRKPSKPPAGSTKNHEDILLSQMPYVSTTGNGPSGKTITGFLYQYTKSEVVIVCVCHGNSFSPAGFVEHAGGVNIKHPLRHIRVIPFAFGC
ncbi:hypothetical protein Dimus_016986 [Dionaea muscipula]